MISKISLTQANNTSARTLLSSAFFSAAIICLFFLAGCATVPVTERKSLVLISYEQERSLGLSAFKQIKENEKLSHDPAMNEAVRRVGTRIAAVSDLKNAAWEFVVIEDDSPNAFCLPGGKIGVHTGIFTVARNDPELATVIAHEIAHAVARHGAERMTQTLLLQSGAAIIGSTAVNDIDVQKVLAAYGIGSALFITLPHSRSQELEADEIGLIYMAKAGYDPRKALSFWNNMINYSKKQKKGIDIPFLSTHPVDSQRLIRIQSLLPTALRYYKGPVGTSTAAVTALYPKPTLIQKR